jgi:hypothetical protein
MSEVKHTPTPWRTHLRPYSVALIGADGRLVASSSWHDASPHYPTKKQTEENFEFISKTAAAYDKHRALIETLTAALEPFAAVAEHDIGTDETAEDFFVPMREYNRVERLRVGDMRLAQAAFDAAKQEGF